MAAEHARIEVEKAEKRVKAAEKMQPRKNEDTGDFMERKEEELEAAQRELAEWQAIAKVPEQRKAQAEEARRAEAQRESAGGDGTAERGGGAADDSPEAGKHPAEAKPLFTYFQGSISELISKAKEKTQRLIKKIIAPVSNRLRDDLQTQGVSIGEGYIHVIDNNAISHTLKKHGGKNERKRGQITITEDDFEKIPDVVENYDEVSTSKNKQGHDSIVYNKEYPDGTVVYVEEVRTSRKELAAVTMWKTNKSALTDANSTKPTQIPDLSGFSAGKGRESGGEKQEAGTKKNGPAADAPYVETRDEKALGKAGEDESLDAKAPSTVVAGGEGKARAGLVMDERSAGLREDQRAMLDAVGKQLGNIYNQFKGKVKEAFAFLKKKKMAFLKVYGIGMT